MSTLLSVLLILCAGPANLALSRAMVLRHMEGLVARSVVRIERVTSYRVGPDINRMINHGTGVVIGEQRVNGHREYLVLSNEHVARNNHVPGESVLHIVNGDATHESILLETLAVDSKRDQALLRTVGCNEAFTVPEYVIGPPPEDIKRDSVFTEGYGGGRFAIIEGEILSTEFEDWGLRCYKVGVAVRGGQSGAPLVVIGADKKLYLAALIFCGDEHFTAATPLYPGKGVLRRITSSVQDLPYWPDRLSRR